MFYQPQPKRWPWIRRIAPHLSYNSFYDFDGNLQSAADHIHPFEIQPRQGGRFGWFMDYNQDAPLAPFTTFHVGGAALGRPLESQPVHL